MPTRGERKTAHVYGALSLNDAKLTYSFADVLGGGTFSEFLQRLVRRYHRKLARWFQEASFPRGRSDLRKQALEAADSVVLNIAEGSGRRASRSAGNNHHEIALGSAAECSAVLDLVHSLNGAEEQQQ